MSPIAGFWRTARAQVKRSLEAAAAATGRRDSPGMMHARFWKAPDTTLYRGLANGSPTLNQVNAMQKRLLFLRICSVFLLVGANVAYFHTCLAIR